MALTIAEITARLEIIDDTINTLQSALNNVASKAQLKQTLAVFQRQLDALQTDVDDLEAPESEDLDADVINNLATKTELKQAIMVLQQEIDALEDSINQLEATTSADLTAHIAGDDHTSYHNNTRGDERYYKKIEFVKETVGVADAGKPVKLNDSGQIDSSMVDVSLESHSDLTNLDADDHEHYLNETRANTWFTGKDLANLGTKSHTSLTDIGTHTHEEIDNFLTSGLVNAFNSRTGYVVPETNDYTWAQVNKTTSDIADITTKSHTSLSDIGSNTHPEIDSHISNLGIHIVNSGLDHGNSTGLLDDDHTQYLLINGTRAMGDDFDVSGHNIINVGTVDGVDVSSLDVMTSLGDITYGEAGGVPTKLTGNVTISQKFLTQTGDGTNSAAPSWQILPVAGLSAYIFIDAASEIGGDYKQAVGTGNYTPTAQISLVTSTCSDGDTLGTFATDPNLPGIILIPQGIIIIHVHAKKSANGTANIYAEIYKRTEAGAETLLVLTEYSDSLTTIMDEFTISATISDTTLVITDRIVVRFKAHVLNGAPDITIDYDGDGVDQTNSRIQIPTVSVDATNFIPYIGAVKAINLGSQNLTTTGTINTNHLIAGDIDSVKIGGTTSSYPALFNNSGSIDIKKADNSAYANLLANNITASGVVYSNSIETDAIYCTDTESTNIYTEYIDCTEGFGQIEALIIDVDEVYNTDFYNDNFYGSYLYLSDGITDGFINISSHCLITSPVDGNILVQNNAGTDFGMIQLGGLTNQFPALQRNGTSLTARLADDSDNTSIIAASGVFNYVYGNGSNLTNLDLSSYDHGVLSGLTDDDHLQYTRVDGTRGFTSPVSGIAPTADLHLATKKYIDDEIAGLTTDHGGLTGLEDDDHTQYLLTNGTRAATYLPIGGLTSSYPSIRNNGNILEAKLADDSSYCPITCSGITSNGNLQVTGQGASLLSLTVVPTGTTANINWDNGNYQILDLESATGNVTLTFENPLTGASYILEVRQDSASARDITWPASVKWPGGNIPVVSTTLDGVDIFSFCYNGTTYFGNYTQDFA